MIKTNIKEASIELKASGNPMNLSAEVALLIRKLYEGIRETDPEDAEEFKQFMIRGVAAPDTPVWE